MESRRAAPGSQLRETRTTLIFVLGGFTYFLAVLTWVDIAGQAHAARPCMLEAELAVAAAPTPISAIAGPPPECARSAVLFGVSKESPLGTVLLLIERIGKNFGAELEQ